MLQMARCTFLSAISASYSLSQNLSVSQEILPYLNSRTPSRYSPYWMPEVDTGELGLIPVILQKWSQMFQYPSNLYVIPTGSQPLLHVELGTNSTYLKVPLLAERTLRTTFFPSCQRIRVSRGFCYLVGSSPVSFPRIYLGVCSVIMSMMKSKKGQRCCSRGELGLIQRIRQPEFCLSVDSLVPIQNNHVKPNSLGCKIHLIFPPRRISQCEIQHQHHQPHRLIPF